MAKNNFKIPMALELLLLSIVPLIITGSLVTILFIRTANNTINNAVEELSTAATEKLDIEITNVIIPFANKVRLLNSFAKLNSQPEFLGTVVQSLGYGEHENFSIYYATEIPRSEEGGIFIGSGGWNPEVEWEPTTRPWYQLGKSNAIAQNNSVAFTDPYIDNNTGELCVTISHAVRDSEQNIIGVAGADLLLGDISTLINGYKVSENGTMSLVDGNGIYIVHDNKSKVMNSNIFDERQIEKSMVRFDGSSISRINTQTFIENDRYCTLSPIAGTPWFVIAEGPISDFSKGLIQDISVFIGVILFQIIVVVIAAGLFSRLITKTFISMVQHCNRFSKGDFTANFESHVIKEADDLSHGFEAFSQNIRLLVGKIFKSAASVSEMSTSLAQVSDSINISVGATVAAISQMDATSSNQTVAVQQVDDAMEKIVAEAEQLSKEIDSQNQVISYSSASIEEIVQSMESVQKRINAASEHVDELVKLASGNKEAVSLATQNIINVRQESASLQEMNSVISSVAAQTNLLAMNAAIEAAHAGAAGQGFAVVADEIRKLAETAAKQASSSSSYLKSIQEKIDGIADTAVGIDKSFTGTIQRINDISLVVTQLEQATGEQEELSEQVLQSLKDIQNSTRNITTNVGEISSSTNQTSQLCHKLRDLNSDVNKGLLACKSASTEMQDASGLINNVAKSTHNSVTDLLEAVSSFRVERRSKDGDRRSQNEGNHTGLERRTSDRRKNHISLEPPTLS